MLPKDMAQKSLRNAFRKWTTMTKKVVAASAPYGRSGATEFVRGEKRPNVHIKNNIATKVKGYSKGTLIWAAVGVKEVRGTYVTPHWYLRWVEFGHDVKRKATMNEKMLLKSRGERIRKNTTIKIGHVKGQHFIAKAVTVCSPRLVPMVEDAIADQVLKEWGS